MSKAKKSTINSLQLSIFDMDFVNEEVETKTVEVKVLEPVIEKIIPVVTPVLSRFEQMKNDLKNGKIFLIQIQGVILAYDTKGLLVYGDKKYRPTGFTVYCKGRRVQRTTITDAMKKASNKLKSSNSTNIAHITAYYEHRTQEQMDSTPKIPQKNTAYICSSIKRFGMDLRFEPLKSISVTFEGTDLTTSEIEELSSLNQFPQQWLVKSSKTEEMEKVMPTILPYAKDFIYQAKASKEEKLNSIQYVADGLTFIKNHFYDMTAMPLLNFIRVKNTNNNDNATYSHSKKGATEQYQYITLNPNKEHTLFHEYYHHLEHRARLACWNEKELDTVVKILSENNRTDLIEAIKSLRYYDNPHSQYIRDLQKKIHKHLLDSNKVTKIRITSTPSYIKYYTSESEVIARAVSTYVHYYRGTNDLDNTFLEQTIAQHSNMLRKNRSEMEDWVYYTEEGQQAYQMNIARVLDYGVDEFLPVADDIRELVRCMLIVNDVHRYLDSIENYLYDIEVKVSNK